MIGDYFKPRPSMGKNQNNRKCTACHEPPVDSPNPPQTMASLRNMKRESIAVKKDNRLETSWQNVNHDYPVGKSWNAFITNQAVWS